MRRVAAFALVTGPSLASGKTFHPSSSSTSRPTPEVSSVPSESAKYDSNGNLVDSSDETNKDVINRILLGSKGKIPDSQD